MDRIARISVACLTVCASLIALLALAGAAAAATPCGTRVLEDWSDNGRIDRLYALHCYEEAIDSTPSDLRDYTDVTEVIERALTAALRETSGAAAPTGAGPQAAPIIQTSGASSVPVVPVAGAGLAFALVLAGGAAYVVRRRAG
jgi:hypothetical protein